MGERRGNHLHKLDYSRENYWQRATFFFWFYEVYLFLFIQVYFIKFSNLIGFSDNFHSFWTLVIRNWPVTFLLVKVANQTGCPPVHGNAMWAVGPLVEGGCQYPPGNWSIPIAQEMRVPWKRNAKKLLMYMFQGVKIIFSSEEIKTRPVVKVYKVNQSGLANYQ